MAFSSAISGKSVEGKFRVHWGTWTSGGTTATGDVNTGLRRVVRMMLTAKGAAIVADAPTINETFPIAGSAITIIFTAATSGYWIAWGYI